MNAVAASPLRGIFWMLAAMSLLVLSNGTTKWFSADYSPGRVVFIRSLFVLLFLIPVVWRHGGWRSLRVASWRNQGLRAVFHTLTALFIVSSVILLPLADAEALLFAAILFIAILSGPVLGEKVGWRRMMAVAIGFIGVIVMLRPTPELIKPAALVGVCAALFTALRDLWSRKLAGTETTNAMMMCSEAGLLLASGLTVFAFWSPLVWQPLDARDLFLMALNGLVFGAAQYALLLAYRHGNAAAVAPFRYSAAIWAVVFGYAMFGELPDGFVIAGAAIVIASGLYILHREAGGQRT